MLLSRRKNGPKMENCLPNVHWCKYLSNFYRFTKYLRNRGRFFEVISIFCPSWSIDWFIDFLREIDQLRNSLLFLVWNLPDYRLRRIAVGIFVNFCRQNETESIFDQFLSIFNDHHLKLTNNRLDGLICLMKRLKSSNFKDFDEEISAIQPNFEVKFHRFCVSFIDFCYWFLF